MAQAELLSRDGDYLAARAEYMQVLEEDASYDAAQRSASAYHPSSVTSSKDSA